MWSHSFQVASHEKKTSFNMFPKRRQHNSLHTQQRRVQLSQTLQTDFTSRTSDRSTSGLLSVLKITILMLASECPCTPLKIILPENETILNLKSASFGEIMRLHVGLTHMQTQIKPWLLFGECFTSNTPHSGALCRRTSDRELHCMSTNKQPRCHYTTNQYSTPNATMVNLQPAEQMRAFGQMCTYYIKNNTSEQTECCLSFLLSVT